MGLLSCLKGSPSLISTIYGRGTISIEGTHKNLLLTRGGVLRDSRKAEERRGVLPKFQPLEEELAATTGKDECLKSKAINGELRERTQP